MGSSRKYSTLVNMLRKGATLDALRKYWSKSFAGHSVSLETHLYWVNKHVPFTYTKYVQHLIFVEYEIPVNKLDKYWLHDQGFRNKLKISK